MSIETVKCFLRQRQFVFEFHTINELTTARLLVVKADYNFENKPARTYMLVFIDLILETLIITTLYNF